MRYIILERREVNASSFIDYWSGHYDYGNESLYDSNIGKPLTSDRIKKLFAWKNGSKYFKDISEKKRGSIVKYYIKGPKDPPPEDHKALKQFLLKPGGSIWRIFWLHCLLPNKYPIFDQHVYRSMCYLKMGEIKELPNSNRKKVDIYLAQYLSFWKTFPKNDTRKVDQAIWSFGKYLKVTGRIVQL
jgi:hypothetical protein